MSKLHQFFKGRCGQWGRLKKAFGTEESRKAARPVWFHCASLGEFEQGRPVMEAYRQAHPDIPLLLTFFSPSGYEIRKNYTGADYVFYLPLDTPLNARRFLNIVQPQCAVFVKYEYWYFFLTALHKRHVPTYLISAIFQPRQPFFKWYGGMYRRILRCYTGLFVQDTPSKELLPPSLPIMVAGDTRFDRVLQICSTDRVPDTFKQWVDRTGTSQAPLLVAGSTWPDDEKNLALLLAQKPTLRLVLAPHEIHADHLAQIKRQFAAFDPFFLSQDPATYNGRVLIIDCIGLLSSLYRYGTLSYIGGGFNPSGIHNTLEAAAYGQPVLFGPNYQKFREAVDLVDCGAGVSYAQYSELAYAATLWLDQPQQRAAAGAAAGRYVQRKAGATERIMNALPQPQTASF